MLSRFHLIPERYGQTDRQTDISAMSISRVSVLTRDKNMLVVGNRRYKKKQYVIGGAGIFDSILQFLIRTFTSQMAKEAAKHVGKAALEAGKTVAVAAENIKEGKRHYVYVYG